MASAEDIMMETPRPAVPDSPLTEAPSAKSMPAKKAKLNFYSPLAHDAAMDDLDCFAPMQPLGDAAQASSSTEGTVPQVAAGQEISREGSRPPKAGRLPIPSGPPTEFGDPRPRARSPDLGSVRMSPNSGILRPRGRSAQKKTGYGPEQRVLKK